MTQNHTVTSSVFPATWWKKNGKKVPNWLRSLRSTDDSTGIFQSRPYERPLRPARTFEDVWAAANVVRHHVQDLVEECCMRAEVLFVPAELKSRPRAEEKTQDRHRSDYSRLFDMLRVSIVCDGYEKQFSNGLILKRLVVPSKQSKDEKAFCK